MSTPLIHVTPFAQDPQVQEQLAAAHRYSGLWIGAPAPFSKIGVDLRFFAHDKPWVFLPKKEGFKGREEVEWFRRCVAVAELVLDAHAAGREQGA